MKKENLQNGDLIFVRSQSEIAEAIQVATGTYNHVALYFNGQVYHATVDRGVIKEPLADFLKPEEVYAFYRYLQLDEKELLARAEQHLGKPYNHSFYPEQDAFYCSEYIAEILPLFETIPMKFGDEKHQISPFWQEYYRSLGLEVPLGQAGTNPSQLAQSTLLTYQGELDD
ncbi:YiiX/YebB-like N1pC/P60 family cysteine hydrolase [Streptococcus massiliensis]|uniref:UDP-N-acetylmuramoylalanyl-D-glutamate--2, 6-diaminopimelate ligase n=1 Tax=Streptococcus massiliensis TaxID=313439 RepID=A0A380KZB7_9STRE|nr:YiiX/YebB-like N1pC/P60 family cysteine hydrolase [Streptococcus massiliensis]SUN77344.1 UDP-N-acetylmuramoylalanyl-D-glutamate--2, 6-diaminopimelate ligase [Streptococcus massiliensis]